LATKYGCDVILLAPQDKIWEQDPFAAGPDYRLAEAREGRWRIYVRNKQGRAEARHYHALSRFCEVWACQCASGA